jgi:hypothetical protein
MCTAIELLALVDEAHRALSGSTTRRILEPSLCSRRSGTETLYTLVHEHAHKSMHKNDRRTQTTKTVRKADAVAVCSGLGLDCGSSSSDYIGLYDDNAGTLTPHSK